MENQNTQPTPHTPEPWQVGMSGEAVVSHEPPMVIAACRTKGLSYEQNKANAKRIVECVNACKGIKFPEMAVQGMKVLSSLSPIAADMLEHVRKERDELLEALKLCHASLRTYGEHPIIDKHVQVIVSKVEGGQ